MPSPRINSAIRPHTAAIAAPMGDPGVWTLRIPILTLSILFLAHSVAACTPMPIPTSDAARTLAPSLTLTVVPPRLDATVVLAATPVPTVTPLPLPNESKVAVGAIRIPTATALLVNPTPVQTRVAYDRSPSAILVEADISGGLAPAPRQAHVPLYRLYADGFVVFAGERTHLSTGLDAVVQTGYLSETEIQELLAFLSGSGFYALEAYYQPKPSPADLPTAYITVNLEKAKTVQVYAPGFGASPAAFYDAFRYILANLPEASKAVAPNEGYLVALPAGSVSDFRSKDVLAEWTPTIGVRLADATDGIMVTGNAFAKAVSIVAQTFPNTLYREGDRAYRVGFTPQLPRAVHLSDWIGTILEAPREFEGRAFDITGYYRGSNLLGEARGNSPVSRSDWVIADETGAIYVTGAHPQGLNPQSRADLWSLVHIRAVVVYVRLGVSHLEARRVEVLARSQPEMSPSPTPTTTLTVAATRTVSSTATAARTSAFTATATRIPGSTAARTPSALPLPTATVSTTAAAAPMRLATRASGAR